jgi:thymidylate kinase
MSMSSSGVIVDVAAAIDAAAQGPVLVIGSWPAAPSSLRLLVRASDAPAIAERLQADGFLRWHSRWARFDRGLVQGAELLTAEAWGLAPGGGQGAEELFIGSRPLPGCTHLALPAPHVVLLLAAHELVLSRGDLPDDQRERVEAAAGSGEGVWDDAAALAARLRQSAALELLRHALARPGPWTDGRRRRELIRALATGPSTGRGALARRLVLRRRRPLLVSLSGPDGSGKSTQVTELAGTLGSLGIPTGTAWVPTTKRPMLPTSIRAWAAGWRRPPADAADVRGSRPSGGGSRPVGHRSAPAHVRLVEHLWITSAAVSNAAKIRAAVWRGRGNDVLVLDRFVLDADVKLTYWYGHRRGADITMERRLFRAVCPKVDASVLLAVDPETNVARRPDEWHLAAFRSFHKIYADTARDLGAATVDAERPVADVARDVAETVWTRLP